MRMGMSATAHRSVTSVIGPIWPTAHRPTTEWAPQTSVVKTSRRIGFAQTDCMSPVLGAVASVIWICGTSRVQLRPRSGCERKARVSGGAQQIGWVRREGNPQVRQV